jgi:adenylate cyclase
MASKSILAGVAIVIVMGLVCGAFRVGKGLADWSYDLAFGFSNEYAPPETIMVTVDDETRMQLGIPAKDPMPRALQAKLLERLTRDGARIVFYDLSFDEPGADPAGDEAFAVAMKKNGNVVLSAAIDDTSRETAQTEITYPPIELFRESARSWGVAGPLVLDPGENVRRIDVPESGLPLSHWVVAELAGAPVTKNAANRDARRWLNYYGKAGTLRWCSFYEALDDRLRAPEFFQGKIICVGGRPSQVGRTFGKDEFSYPHARFGKPYITGLEIHTTALLNLLRSEWLVEMPLALQLVLIALIGLGVGAAMFVLNPLRSVLTVLIAAALIAIGSIGLQIHGHVWWNWLVPVAVQVPLAIVCSLAPRAAGYAGELRRRKQLREAFSLYLSPQMADRIADEKIDLKPGGKLVEATVMFTDCKGFTAMSEELGDPQRISETLIAYFTETSKHVLENDGTILKYIGDAVFACWNAPIAEPEHAAKAAKAAWAMYVASKAAILGRSLTTRVGVCTGEVLAGNLGSPYRFDYTAIGETVNFASRLEGLNKYLGTNVLISDSTRQGLGKEFVLRSLGNFVVAGKTSAVAIHELIAPPGESTGDLVWLTTWDEAMKALRQGDFAAMQKALREIVWQRGGSDGPSEFYLKYISKLEKEDLLREWTGIVKLTEK